MSMHVEVRQWVVYLSQSYFLFFFWDPILITFLPSLSKPSAHTHTYTEGQAMSNTPSSDSSHGHSGTTRTQTITEASAKPWSPSIGEPRMKKAVKSNAKSAGKCKKKVEPFISDSSSICILQVYLTIVLLF